MTSETPAHWFHWLPFAEWWYNSSFHSAIQLTPYEALYGQPPPTHIPYLAGASSVATVDRSLQAREAARKLLYRIDNTLLEGSPTRSCLLSFMGPFRVIAKVGAVAYTLQLPQNSRIHPTFHVSQLKRHVGSAPIEAQLPPVDDHGAFPKEPTRIIDRRMVKRGNQATTEVLIEWSNSFPKDATWESLSAIQSKFPHLHP
ncbi:uncharacterized protein [Gossypium hirsutum]|uniref:Chromo domain-containing protein n=1 Tax=Gossypium hirsutum TaxID=3635 RepID=A0A1U8MUR7_GOSHI|nr:uncharacterized protein LOC107941526 [Gossypium hirsutum]